jgi:predicted small lipoprotein YifL
VSLLSSRSLKISVVALSLALAAAGCGRRGALEPPPGGKAIPGEENAQPEDMQSANPGAIANPLGQPQKRNEPIKPPSGPFVLDFLL